MTGKEDLYIILEVRRTASVNEIKRAFRKLARRYHPDVNPGDRQAEDVFKRITEAYEVLSNPLKRQFYDVNGFYTDGVLDQPREEPRWNFTFKGFEFSRSDSSSFGEIFGRMFDQREAKRERARGQDLEYPVSLSFEESIRGSTRRITIFRNNECAGCNATGRDHASRDWTCNICGGTGKATKVKGHLQFAITCGDCGGTGKYFLHCEDCGGDGRVSGSETLDVELPPGVATGSRIRVPGRGDAGYLGGPPGDLYIVTNIASHPFFTRMGDNIHCTIPLTVTEAALGTKVEVPTIHGRAVVRIPPSTQTGQSFRLRGMGAPSLLHPGMRGDQYVEVKIVVPRIGDERSKEILRELAKLNPENPRKGLWNGT